MNEEKFINNRIWIVFGAVQLVFLIIIGAIFLGMQKPPKIPEDYNSQPKIRIQNIDQALKTLPEKEKKIIAQELTRAIDLNIDSISFGDITAIIRDNFVKRDYAHQNLTFYNLVVDIPSIEQSYRIYHEYSSDETNKFFTLDKTTIVTCLNEKDTKKYDFNCKSRYEQTEDERILNKYLHYESFDTFSASVQEGKTISITPIGNDVDAATKEQYINKAKMTIGLLGFSPEAYKYNVIDSASLTYELP